MLYRTFLRENTFSKIVALIWKEVRLKVSKDILNVLNYKCEYFYHKCKYKTLEYSKDPSPEILEIWKFENLKKIEILNI